MKYDAETKAKAVRLVTEHSEDYASEYLAIKTIADRMEMKAETLRKWDVSAPSPEIARGPRARRRGRSGS